MIKIDYTPTLIIATKRTWSLYWVLLGAQISKQSAVMGTTRGWLRALAQTYSPLVRRARPSNVDLTHSWLDIWWPHTSSARAISWATTSAFLRSFIVHRWARLGVWFCTQCWGVWNLKHLETIVYSHEKLWSQFADKLTSRLILDIHPPRSLCRMSHSR